MKARNSAISLYYARHSWLDPVLDFLYINEEFDCWRFSGVYPFNFRWGPPSTQQKSRSTITEARVSSGNSTGKPRTNTVREESCYLCTPSCYSHASCLAKVDSRGLCRKLHNQVNTDPRARQPHRQGWLG